MNKQPVHPTASQKGPDSINLGTGLAGLQENEKAALERLIAIAKRDTEQSRRVADFLLASWNSPNCGGFDLTNLWAVDTAIPTRVCSKSTAYCRSGATRRRFHFGI
jgi:hypothetical protein